MLLYFNVFGTRIQDPLSVRNETSEVFCQFSQGEIQFSPIRRNQAARNYDSSVREQMFEHAVFGSASAL